MIRAVYLILTIIAGFMAAVFTVGVIVPTVKTTTVSKEIAVSSNTVWALLTNIQTYTEWHPEIMSVQLIGTNALGYPKWKQFSQNGASETFEITSMLYGTDLGIKLDESPFHVERSWAYRLTPTKTGVMVELKQTTKIPGIFMRGFLSLLGSGHSDSKEELANLNEVALRVEKR
jgi:hypothetical protein